MRIVAVLFVVTVAAGADKTVWDGVYTKDQSQRGQTAYAGDCMKCHGENLAGGEGGPPLAGDEFRQKWNAKTVGALFESIRKTMPSDDPGSLSSRQYADILAYILSVNEFPAGQKELEHEAAPLNEIRIEVKR